MKINLFEQRGKQQKKKQKKSSTLRRQNRKQNHFEVLNQELIDQESSAKTQRNINFQHVKKSSEKYFKKVFNQERIYRKIQAEERKRTAEGQPHCFSQKKKCIPQDLLEQKVSTSDKNGNESNTDNFSLGIFNKSMAPSSSFIQQNRKSLEKHLNYNKIFIVAHQNSPFKQVIPLSLKQLQNKEMLQKAVHELNKLKFKKKIKILPKNLVLASNSKIIHDELLDKLRKQKIGYKTFFLNQIQTKKIKTEEDQKFKNPQSQWLKPVTQISHLKNIRSQKKLASIELNNDIIHKQSDHKKQSPHFKLPLLSNTPQKSNGRNSFSPTQLKSSLTSGSQKKFFQSFTLMKKFSNFIIQPKGLSLCRSPYKKYQGYLQRSTDRKNSIENKMCQDLAYSQFQNDQFPFLLAKEDLELTLNKSRYQVKKLLCLHIQKRKKLCKHLKNRSLFDISFKQPDNRETLNQNSKFKEKAGQEIITENQYQQKQKTDLHPSVPNHLLKFQTRELKKSMKSFVAMISRRDLSIQNKKLFSSRFP